MLSVAVFATVRSPLSIVYVFVKATVVGSSLSILNFSLVTVAVTGSELTVSVARSPTLYVETTEYPSGLY